LIALLKGKNEQPKTVLTNMPEKTDTPPTTIYGSDPWSRANAIRYYSSHRNSVADIYESEKFFLSKVLKPGDSILDIGCATGGFVNIFRQYEPTVSYTGVDISAEMIHQARILHPGIHFEVADGDNLPFENNSFDIVFSSGALHMAPNWREMLAEAWRVAKKYFIFDVRLKTDPPTIEDIRQSFEKIAFSGRWDGKTIVPYIIIDVKMFKRTVDALRPAPSVQQIYGYYHRVSGMTVTPERQVCMTMCCLVKDSANGKKDLWNIPIPRPD
jgi:ubiquinone/menaquinone biosynthesis C-methylase UbiE